MGANSPQLGDGEGPNSPRIPLCVVTGFLGSGKTTLLAQMVEQLRGRRIAFVVNEFAHKDIDGQRLALSPEQLTTVAGGSIFCTCKVTEFIAALQAVALKQPEGVIIEASGMADPSVMQRLLHETKLDQLFDWARCVCVVDPGSLPKLLHTLPNMQAQLRAADVVVINKVDLYDADRLSWCAHEICSIQPRARIEYTQHGNIKEDWFATAGRTSEVLGEYARCVDPHFCNQVASIPAPVDVGRLQRACDALGADLYRVKGVIPTAQGALDIDRSASGWQQRSTQETSYALVLIAAGSASERLRLLVQALEAGTFSLSYQPQTPKLPHQAVGVFSDPRSISWGS